MRIAQEEIFGPVLSLIRVPDNGAALSVANNVRFGLSASVYTNDVPRCSGSSIAWTPASCT